MTEGYPDYARLAQQGGSLLYANTGSIPENTVLFQGYVGPWPYINMFTDPHIGAENVTIVIQWFTDFTFTTQVGFRYAVRSQFSIAGTQYANLSPWLRIYYTTASGNPIAWDLFGVYGATGVADANELLSSDAPVLSGNPVIAANTTSSFFPEHQSYGPGKFNLTTTLATWHVNVFYLAANTYVYTFYWRMDNISNPGGGTIELPSLDTQFRFDIANGTAAANNINFGFMYG